MWEATTTRKFFCENLGEDDLTPKQCRPRVDPVLKLFQDCPLMMTDNKDVAAGMANGTCGTLEQIMVPPGEQSFPVKLDDGNKVKAFFASQIDLIMV